MVRRGILAAAVLGAFAVGAPAPAQESQGIQFPAFKSIEAHGDVWLYFFNPFNSYLTDDLGNVFPAEAGRDPDFHWAEFIARLGFDFDFDGTFGGQFRPLYAATINQDYFLNPSDPDANGGTVDRFVIDLANVHANGLRLGTGAQLDLTFGRQEFSLGQGFVFSDGFNDFWQALGVEGEYPAIWVIPRSSWDGARARIYGERFEVNLFASFLSESWGFFTESGFGGEFVPGNGSVLVGDFAYRKPEGNGVYGEVAGGVYFVNQENEDRLVDLHNDMYTISHDIVALDARLDLTWPQGENGSLNVSGEFVFEPCCDIGDEAVVTPVEFSGAFAFHGDVVYTFDHPLKPFVAGGVRFYRGDDPTTPEIESYNPLFYGFTDWGKWYQGNITGELFLLNQNELILTPSVGISSRDGKHRVRAYVFHVRLDEPIDPAVTSKSFATEVNVLWDYAPTDNWFAGLEFEAGRAGDALKGNLGPAFDETQFQVITWVGFTF